MDFQYPSHGNVDIVKQLNRLDKLTSKLNLTLKDMPDYEPITKSQKQQIVKFISNDKAHLLFKYMEKEVIAADREVGAKGSRWNLLHLCAKYDALECTKILLRKMFQQDQSEYLQLVNNRTAQGYTALMITVIYQSNRTLEVLLRYGGSDLAIMQSSKLRAYDLALNYRNEKAIKELIVYEDRCKKQMYLNKEELAVEIVIEEQKGWVNSVMNCLFDYLLCLNREQLDNQPANQVFIHKISNLLKGDEKVYEIDSVKIGSRKDIEDYEIEWKKLSEIQGQKFILFDSFKPLDITENQFTLRNNLILFQALSDYSWIIKRAINKVQNKSSSKNNQSNKFGVSLYKNFANVKFEVDECIPFIKERGQIMFLSNPNQIWPHLLQKGLAKLYNSYLQLNSITPSQTLEDITGFYSHSLPISSFTASTLVTDLQELNMKGYIVLLQGRQKTELNSSSTPQIYSILNYYQKGNIKKILVNCPNVVDRWQQPKQNRQLAIIKSHFNKHNQSCLWIDQSKLAYYFKNATLCYLRSNYLRSELKIKMKIKQQLEESNKDVLEDNGKVVKNYKKAIFFKFKVQRQALDDPIMLQLVDMQTKHRFDLSTLSGWKNDGSQVLIHQVESSYCKQLTKIIPQPGQYTCMYQISQKQIVNKSKNRSELNKSIIKKKEEQQGKAQKKVKLNLGPEHLRELLLLSWWGQSLHIEYLEEQFGSIEWLSHFKNYSILNWSYLMKDKQQEDCFLYQTVNKRTILLIKTKKVKRVLMQLLEFSLEEWKRPNSLIEGSFVKSQLGDAIELVCQMKNPNFFYAVLSNIPIENIEREKKIRFLYEYEE